MAKDHNLVPGDTNDEPSDDGSKIWDNTNLVWKNITPDTVIDVAAGPTGDIDGRTEVLHEVTVTQDMTMSLTNPTEGLSIAVQFVNGTGTDWTITLDATFDLPSGTTFVVLANTRKVLAGLIGANDIAQTQVVDGAYDV